MILRNLIGKVNENTRILGLAGMLSLGLASSANAQDFAPLNENLIQFGARSESSVWSYGPKVDSSGFYIQVGRGFNNRFSGYLEGNIQNIVINEGFERPGYTSVTTDVGPNHFIPGIGIGARVKIYESDDKQFSINGDLKLSRLSEFDENVSWTSNVRSEIHVDGVTSIDTSVWAEKHYGMFSLRGGVNLNSSFAEGEVLTYTINSPSDVRSIYSNFNQRNKNGINGLLGISYDIGEWRINSTATIGNSNSIDIGFRKCW